ncbi:serine--tRNA ligase, cytoplasmic-like [Hibiscus syriacus]|uniref:serine--tRNA ligase, cytoplasmic-like n=1 Tax=Hibiscus syriacus TaxID=106335 RepID=UPI001920AFB2|nr:serine--tRNA ligase, cytoplasmic-like [Hibiscus syriacus]
MQFFKILLEFIYKCNFWGIIGLTPYQIVVIASGALNAAAADKNYDLEAWFPASQTYRELLSCSNSTDLQIEATRNQIWRKKAEQYVHLLNSTITATKRTMCCIVENYQKEDGVSCDMDTYDRLPFAGNINLILMVWDSPAFHKRSPFSTIDVK